ncbi:hypothetical protein [Methylobacterium sp. 174MFSha1.1]|uniref:hypothetical protein n=1 Tax=Methylobacterium sp. 174MFSha1.1 TaxID=1502749 RepID=UPI0011601D26|nr:hypothetical protein [Methylobacterium sp. 174MFSha1.1]
MYQSKFLDDIISIIEEEILGKCGKTPDIEVLNILRIHKRKKQIIDASLQEHIINFKSTWPYVFDVEELDSANFSGHLSVGAERICELEMWLDARNYEYGRMGWMIGMNDLSAATAFKLAWS